MNKSLIITLLVTLIIIPSYAQEKNAKKIRNLNLVIGDNKVAKSKNNTEKFNFGALNMNNDGKLSVDDLAIKKDMEKKKLKIPVFKSDKNKSSKKASQDSPMKSSKSSKSDRTGSGKSSGGSRSGGKGGK